MPRWWVSEPYIDLWMSDTPLSYTMSSGKELEFTFYYKQGYTLPGSDQIPSCPLVQGGIFHQDGYFRALPGYGSTMTNAFWGNNWMANLFFWEKSGSNQQFKNGYEVLYFNPNGGISYFYITNYIVYTNQAPYAYSVTNSCLRDPQSQVEIQPLSGLGYPTGGAPVADPNGIFWGAFQTNGFQLIFPDGSRDLFALCTYLAPNAEDYGPDGYYAVLTQRIDPQGRITRIGYEWGVENGNYRVRYVVDPDGRTNTFQYAVTNYASLLQFSPSEIDDPYGRKTTLSYDLLVGNSPILWTRSA